MPTMTKTIQPEPVTLKSTIESLGKLRHVSSQERDEDRRRQPLNFWADYLDNLTLRRSKQVTLDEFLTECGTGAELSCGQYVLPMFLCADGVLSLANSRLISAADQKPG